MSIYWGDLHNHCAVSYGSGTAARALDNAKQQLDFCTITGHAFWPDMPMELERFSLGIGIHLGGFAKLQYYWKDLMREMETANRAGEFVTIPSYEWHSREFGDYNCYFNRYDAELIDGPDRKGLEQNLRDAGREFFMMPHHCAYTLGHRGLNWGAFDGKVSPLIEIFSNHGCGESDDAPYDYHHSMGPRSSETMVRTGLTAGHRFGFAAGTDSHDGYPGHYGHGRVGVIADRLDLKSIWEALMNRRTIASTGARFLADVSLGDAGIGQVGARGDKMLLNAQVEGSAPIERVDIIEGCGEDWRLRRLPGNAMSFNYAPGRYKVKVECGWGRGDIRVDWEVSSEVSEGKLLGVTPCFRHSVYPNSEHESSDRILESDEKGARWVCRSVPNPAGMMGGTHFNASGTQAVMLDIEAGAQTRLKVNSKEVAFDLPLEKLVAGSVADQINGYGTPAIKVNRATPEAEFNFQYEEAYQPLGEGAGFAYLRVVQSDGQVAWVSPIWFE